MTDPEAPTKDEAIDAFFNDGSGNKKRAFYNRHGVSAADYLRSHIAALEHKHDDLVTRCVQAESDRDALEEQIKLMSKHQAGVDEKLCVLEAENKRLVDYSRMLVTISIQALERLSINPTTRTSYLINRLDTAINGMQIVLAQTGEKS